MNILVKKTTNFFVIVALLWAFFALGERIAFFNAQNYWWPFTKIIKLKQINSKDIYALRKFCAVPVTIIDNGDTNIRT